MVKKRGDNKKSSEKSRGKRKSLKKLPGILWFILGVVITLWTLLWLFISLNSEKFGSVKSVILFGIGFYAMCAFIVGTLIYYIIRFIKKQKHKRKNKNIKEKQIQKKPKTKKKSKKQVRKKKTRKKK
jgi:uncharacterized integral membrane protein